MNVFERKLLDIAEFNSQTMLFADPARQVLNIDNYAYIVDTTGRGNLTAANPLSTKIVMDSDSDFVLYYISGGAVIPGVGTNPTRINPTPAIDVQIRDLASGRTYFNAPTPMPMIAGFNGFPFILTSPRIIRARSTLQIDMTVTITAGAVTYPAAFMAFHGARIYYG